MNKTMQYVYKGGIAVAALLASFMLFLPLMTFGGAGASLFDYWELPASLMPAADLVMMICYSIAFFLGFVVAVLAVLSMFVDNALLNKIFKILAIVLAVIVVVGLICNFVALAKGVSIGAAGIVSAIFAVATAGLVMAEKALIK